VFKLNKFLSFTTLFLLAGCATSSNNDKKIANNNSVENKSGRIQEHLVEKNLPNCDTCIIGGAGDQELKNTDKQIYFLYGAEHLNLKNYYFDIPVVYNDATKKWINYFTGRGRDLYGRYAARAGRYAPVLSKILNDQGLPRDLIYLSMAESGFQNHARSWAKAVGPWQFMPFTGKKFGLDVGFFLDERRDPLKATVAASMYLRDLYEMFGNWELAMAGYNAGEGKIKRAIRRYHTTNFWKLREGRYLKAETKNYVPKIMAMAIIGKNLEAFGFTNIEFDRPLDFEEISVPGNADLYQLAQMLETDFETLKKYNPELVRWQTPPGVEEYIVRTPVGLKNKWDLVSDKSVVIAKDYQTYQLQGYANLSQVAAKFKVPVKILEQINDFPAEQKLFPKTVVYLPFRNDHKQTGHLYADLHEKPRAETVRRMTYQNWVNRGRDKGESIGTPKEFYVVKKGDTLWDIARKTGVDINTIIRSNYKLVKQRMILPGDKLAIR
jgi:membrane-bound lytic murein transglycosylase D